MIKSICVYCGSSKGNDPSFEQAAYELGKELARRKKRLVYGGAKVGLMGAVAKGVLDNEGEVLGVIPKFLDHIEISNDQVTELIITQTMHERKTIMADKSDAFIALPGGMGTLEEIAEILTWAQLGLVGAPVGFLNIDGYFDHLLEQFRVMHRKGLLKPEHLNLFVSAPTPKEIVNEIIDFKSTKTSFEQKLGLT